MTDKDKVFRYYPPEDIRFVDKISRTFDAPRKVIEHLDSEQLGRAILYAEKDEDGGEILYSEIMGYILPVSKEGELQDQHIIFMTSGDMVGVECADVSNSGRIEKYEKKFSAISEPWEYEESDNPLAFIKSLKKLSPAYNARVALSSDNPAQLKTLGQWFEKAMDRVAQTRERREAGRVFTDKLLNAATIFEKPTSPNKKNPSK